MFPRLRSQLILVTALFLCAEYLSAQPAQVEYRELIVQVPGIAGARGFPEIRNKMINIPGVQVVAFCETQHLIMLKIEKKKLPNNRPVFEAISQLEYKFHVKEGASIARAVNACKDKKVLEYRYDDLSSE